VIRLASGRQGPSPTDQSRHLCAQARLPHCRACGGWSRTSAVGSTRSGVSLAARTLGTWYRGPNRAKDTRSYKAVESLASRSSYRRSTPAVAVTKLPRTAVGTHRGEDHCLDPSIQEVEALPLPIGALMNPIRTSGGSSWAWLNFAAFTIIAELSYY
jgi:hypothetical protein